MASRFGQASASGPGCRGAGTNIAGGAIDGAVHRRVFAKVDVERYGIQYRHVTLLALIDFVVGAQVIALVVGAHKYIWRKGNQR